MQAKVLGSKVERKPLLENIASNVKKGTTICTDELNIYRNLPSMGFEHKHVRHAVRQYVNGIAHTNSLDGFWSQLKRSINGTFHHVSPKYLPGYVNEFVYRYNLRGSESPIFLNLSEKVAEQHA
jgi:transposase-like protein